MDLKLSSILGPVKTAILDAASSAEKKRLFVLKEESSCKSGCSACCNRLIRITVAEGILLYDHLLKNGKWSEARKKAKEQLPLVKDINPIAWFKMNQSCPVLDDKSKTCMAYEMRPVKCSTHFVKSSPDLCDPWKTAPGSYEVLDMDDVLDKFRKRFTENVDGYGIFQIESSIPVSLLLAERITIQSGLGLDKIISMLYNEL